MPQNFLEPKIPILRTFLQNFYLMRSHACSIGFILGLQDGQGNSGIFLLLEIAM